MECCATCDYGVLENECVVVPSYSLTYQLGMEEYQTYNSRCSVMLTFHRCDKRGYMDENGRRYECKPVMGQLSRKLSGGSCDALMELAYEDVVECEATRNNNLNVGCDIYVD